MTRWQRIPALVLAMALLNACASEGVYQGDADAETAAAVQDLLADTDYVDLQNCLPVQAYRSVEVLDEQTLLFHGRGERLWLNQLRSRCPGLRPRDALMFEVRSGRVCKLDTVREYETGFLGGRPGIPCSLGEFEEIPPAQAQLLRDLLKR